MLGIIVSLAVTLNRWPGHSHHSTPSIGRIFEDAFSQELPECFQLFLVQIRAFVIEVSPGLVYLKEKRIEF